MRLYLIERGGFVGLPLKYLVDTSKLSDRTLASLRAAIKATEDAIPPEATSAGSVTIRLEHDDDAVEELSLPNALRDASTDRLLANLRRASKLVGRVG